MNWKAAALALNITEPVNGSWQQAIASELGATEPVNGSWQQAIADNIDGGGGEPLANLTTLENFLILDYQAGAGPKGTDIYEFQFQIFNNDSNPVGAGPKGTDIYEFQFQIFNNDSNPVGEDEAMVLLCTNYENGFYVATMDAYTRTIGVSGYPTSDQLFYFGAFYANPGGPVDYVLETQFVNMTTKQVSSINTFTVTLAPPTP